MTATHLLFPLPLPEITGFGVGRGALPDLHYNPSVVTHTSDGVALTWGSGGSLVDIRLPGHLESVMSRQREVAHWCDDVMQCVATNAPLSDDGNPDSDRLFYQCGSYSKGVLANKAGYAAPMVHLSDRADIGVLASYNLLINAHSPANSGSESIPDRILAYSRWKRVGVGVWEVTQVLNNFSMYSLDGGALGTDLDHFNFPWLVLSHNELPHVVAWDGTTLDTISANLWPTSLYSKQGVVWAGAFRSPDHPGVAIAFPPSTKLKAGRKTEMKILEDGRDAPPWTMRQSRSFILSAITRPLIRPGQSVTVRYYVIVGRTPLATQAIVNALPLRQLFLGNLAGSVDLCGLRRNVATGRNDLCGPDVAQFFLARAWSHGALPVFEVRKNGLWYYSTDPWLGNKTKSYLTDPAYSVVRVMGWTFPQGTPGTRLTSNGVPFGKNVNDPEQLYK